LNFQRIPKLQQQDQGIWWDTLAKMQKLFRKAAISLFNSGKIDKDTMHNYYMSGINKKRKFKTSTATIHKLGI